MNNIYRMTTGDAMCERCLDMAQRVHELESHDMDESDLRKYAWDTMSKVLFLGIALSLIGGGSALVGLYAYESVPGGYGFIVAGTIWLFGALLFVNAIIITLRYHNEKNQLINRLYNLQRMRQKEIRERNNERLEAARKKKEDSSVG